MKKTRRLALHGAKVWDGSGSRSREAAVLLDGRKIADVIPPGNIPCGYEAVDLTGKIIVPGLFDMHGHLYGRATEKMCSQHEAYCPLYLAGGITTIRTPGEFEPLVTLKWKEDIENEKVIGPRVLSAGSYFDRNPSIVRWIEPSNSVEEIKAKYYQWRDKIDFVKVYSNMPKEWIAALAELAHSDGFKVYGHLGACAAYDALDAGLDGMEHGFFTMSEFYGGPDPHSNEEALDTFDPYGAAADRVIRKILETNAAITPTTITFMLEGKAFTDRVDAVNGWRYLSAEAYKNHKKRRREMDSHPEKIALQDRLIEKQYQFVSRIVRGGGRVFCGTDPSYPLLIPGDAIVWEAENLSRCGMSCEQIMLALTSEAAREMKVFSVTGSIEAGKEADLCVLDKDPFENIANIAAVHSVYKGGRKFNPAELRESAVGMMR